jgi:hypothetical protein
VISKNEETQERNELESVETMVFANRNFLSGCTIIGEKSHTNPTVMYRALWPKTAHNGKRMTPLSALRACSRTLLPRRIKGVMFPHGNAQSQEAED